MIWAMIAFFFVLMGLGVPIAFSMGFSALAYFLVEGIPLSMLAQRFFSNTQSFAFLAVPFFILTGALMVHAGIAQRIIRFADSLVRWLPGGLGCVSVLTNMVMAGVSGSSVADCAAVGSVIIPEMKKTGYHASFAAAINASASVVGIIIPPSSTMIIIAWLTNLSVGRMFIAGALPGVLICVAYFIVTVWISLRRGYPRGSRPTLREIGASVVSAVWALVLPVFLIGSIVLGVATATEAASISAVFAFAVGVLIYRSLGFQAMVRALRESAYSTSVVMMIVCSATVFTWILIKEGIPGLIAKGILSLGLSGAALKLLLVAVLLVAGMVMDLVPNLFIFIPIFYPIAHDLGFDPIHFSIVLLCTLALGLFTPPVGSTLFLSCLLAGVKIEDTVKDLIPFFLAGVAAVLVILFVPQLSLWLPNLLFGE
jgi:tripartite ATP-independent transporter DctM subunit